MKTNYGRYIQQKPRADGFSHVHVSLKDTGLWDGFHLEEWHGASQDLEETVLLRHALVVNMGDSADRSTVRNDVRWVDHRPVTTPLAPGTLGFFPEQMAYSAVSRGTFHGFVVAIDPAKLSAACVALGCSPRAGLRPGIGLQDDLMVHAITAMAADIRGGHAHGAMYGESIGAALLARIVTQHAGKAVSLDSHASFGKLQQARVRDFVHEHLAADLSLAAMAALLQCDVYTLTRWFKSVFGLPPHRYVLRQRVQRSQSLLHSTTLPLTEIALQCGFYSHSHFTGVFKRHVGTTPNQYRLKRRP